MMQIEMKRFSIAQCQIPKPKCQINNDLNHPTLLFKKLLTPLGLWTGFDSAVMFVAFEFLHNQSPVGPWTGSDSGDMLLLSRIKTFLRLRSVRRGKRLPLRHKDSKEAIIISP